LWSRSDSCFYKSRLEEKEAPLYFYEILTKAQNEREDYYNAILKLISDENKKLLELIMERCQFFQELNL